MRAESGWHSYGWVRRGCLSPPGDDQVTGAGGDLAGLREAIEALEPDERFEAVKFMGADP